MKTGGALIRMEVSTSLYRQKGEKMLSIEGYIKLILKKRGLTVSDLARMLTEEEKKHGSNKTVYKTNLNPELKHERLGLEMARKIEIALKLPKFQLVNMMNPHLTEKQVKWLENVYKE